MALLSSNAEVADIQPWQNNDANSHNFALFSLTSLFFIWGFLTSLNDILIPHFKAVFSLNYTQAMLVQFCFFGAYLIVSLPAGRLVEKIGYQQGIVSGLVIAAVGCSLFFPASVMVSYPVFLLALFILAAGITILQVSANPYVSALGTVESASARLTMTQAFNSLGTTIAPLIGAVLILGSVLAPISSLTNEQTKFEALQVVQLPYLLLALSLFSLSFIFAKLKLPVIKTHQPSDVLEANSNRSLLSHTNLVLGAVGIFLYVGAEVSIGSFLINFLSSPDIAATSESESAALVAYYWGGAMLGRFIGAIVMQLIKPSICLAFNAFASIILLLVTMLFDGSIAMTAILLVGVFNSIMFPTIFSLALKGLKSYSSQGSGLLCLAIVGGAIVPILQGMLADTIGIQMSFILPACCYLFVAYYGIKRTVVNDT